MPEDTQAPVVEEVKNCPACKKPLKKARRFYRNGAYYCNNNCFKKVQAAAKAEALEASKEQAPEAVKEQAPAAANPSEKPGAGE